MLELIGRFASAAALGGMVFFSPVVAPSVFRLLDEESAGRFLRGLFPAYYLFLSVAFIGIFLGELSSASWHLTVGMTLVVSTLWVRQELVPRINTARDQQQAGDAASGTVFNTLHRVSMAINMVQLSGVIALMSV